MLNNPDTLLRSFTASSLLFLWHKRINRMQKDQSEALNFKSLHWAVYNRTNASGLLIKEHIGFGVLDAGLRHLSHALVVELVPQLVHVVPAVRDVVATWGETQRVRAGFTNPTCEFHVKAPECRTRCGAEKRVSVPTHCWQCRGDRWRTAGRSWWSGRSCPWPEKAAGPDPRAGTRRGCWSWWRTSARVWSALGEYTKSATERIPFCHFKGQLSSLVRK